MKQTIIKFDLDAYLREKNMTQKTLCEETGLRPSTVSAMKRNEKLNLRHLAVIMDYFKDYDLTRFLKVLTVEIKE
jgi:putative transcriptional regulator